MIFRAQRALGLILPFAGLSGLSSPASAENTPPPIGAPEKKEEKPPELVPYRQDLVGGHFQLGVGGHLAFPFGSVSEDLGTRFRAGLGGGLTGDLSMGLNRHVALGLYGTLGWFGSSSACENCSANTFGGGTFVRYHLSQGLRIDPWVSYGVGVVTLGADTGAAQLDYLGLEWMRLTVGANWSASTNFLVGPTLGLNFGHMLDRPENEDSGGPFVQGIVGLRIEFDVPGRRK